MTDWSLVQRGWPNRYDAYQYEMYPGYQQVQPDAVPKDDQVQQPIPEQQQPAPQNIPMQNDFPVQTSQSSSLDMMLQQYLEEPQNTLVQANQQMPEEFQITSEFKMQQNYPIAEYLQMYPETYQGTEPSVSQNMSVTYNTMFTSDFNDAQYEIDPASVPLPADMPMSQSVPMAQDVCMSQYIEQPAAFSMAPTTTSLSMLLSTPASMPSLPSTSAAPVLPAPRPENPREIRNKAEKHRRDKLNRSIADLASMVPPIVAASRKIDKTGVLRLTAHYLRAHEYVFGDSLAQSHSQQFKSSSMRAVMGLFNGFLLTVTYKGIIVVVSENVQQYLGYSELELLGHNILNITHEEDQEMLIKQLNPKGNFFGPNGELLVPDEPDGIMKIVEALGREKRKFIVRLKKLGQRSEPDKYISCHIEGSFRKSDKACSGPNRCCQMVRRARARSENHCSSGNDVVFIGVVRPKVETFMTEIGLESFRMEYRTRHSIDGEIIQCEQRIALVTGYMIHEVQGVNAMNFMHKDDVYWVIIALRDMYDKHRLFGESCYRLMTKNGDFIYMRTRGRLDVDKDSRVVTSFVCTNTVVDEIEGKYLIKMMKKKFNIKTKKVVELPSTENGTEEDKKDLPVEDPRQLEKVILHLVTNLPSQGETCTPNRPAVCGETSSLRLAIIPPKKERIVNAIEKIYSVIKTFPKPRTDKNPLAAIEEEEEKTVDYQAIPGTSQSFNNVSNENQISIKEIDKDSSLHLTDLSDAFLQKQIEDSVQIPTTSLYLEPFYSEFDLTTQPIMADSYSFINALQVAEYASEMDEQFEVADQTATELNYDVQIAPEVAQNDMTEQDKAVSQEPMPGPSKCGLKRPIECVESSTTKKKHVDDNEETKEETAPDDDFSCLEALFDEALFDKQIESAINSLEQANDPTFPDLLISNEVQEILKELEEQQKKDNGDG